MGVGKQWKQWDTLFWGAPKSLQVVTAAMKLRRLLLGRKAMTNLDSILKSRDITLTTEVRLVKAMVFAVVMYWCESWTINKAERQRTDAFELRCWRRLFRVPWSARRSNQLILKEVKMKWSRSVVSDSLRPRGLKPSRILRPWDSPGKSTRVGCHFLLQGIFLTQRSNLHLLLLLLWQVGSLPLSHLGGQFAMKSLKIPIVLFT